MPAQPLMPPDPDSPAAPFLFSSEVIKEITDLEERGIYTAARCPPDKRRAILTLLKEGRSFREVAQLVTKCADETVKAVYEAHAAEIDAATNMAALVLPKARYALHKQLDRLITSPSIVPGAGIGVLAKTLYDMTALEEGKPTERSEHTETRNVFVSFQAMAAKLKQKKVAGEVILSPNTGFHGGKTPALNQPEPQPGQQPETPGADPRSEHLRPGHEATPVDVTGLVTDPAPKVQTSGDPGDPPRGGDRPPEGLPSTSTDNGSRNFQANESEER